MKRQLKVLAATMPVPGILLALGAWGCQSVSVQVVPVVSVEVVPASVTLIVGESQELQALPRDAGGTVLPGRPVEWSVDDESVARVDPDGVVDAVGPGVTRVTASSDAVIGAGEVTVEPMPSIAVDPTEVDFTAVEGQEDPPPDTVSVGNGGGGTLSDLNREIVYPEGGATGWLDAELTAPAAPSFLILRADIGTLVEGEYRASVLVRSSVAENSPQEVQVVLSVAEPPPRIVVSSTEVFMSGSEGATEPAVVEVGVSNGGGGTLDGLGVVGLSYEEGQPAGWLEAAFESPVAPTSLVLQARSRTLAPGTYGATVTISAPDASNAPVTINVTFQVGL